MRTLIFVAIAALPAILYAGRGLFALSETLRLRVRPTRLRSATDAEVPAHVSRGLLEPVGSLEGLGFERIGFWVYDGEGADALRRFSAALFQPIERAYAEVTFASMPETGAPWAFLFTTLGEDDRIVRTVSAAASLSWSDPPGVVTRPTGASRANAQWEAHKASVRAAALVPATLDHDAALALWRDRQTAHFEDLVTHGLLLPVTSGGFVLAWRLARRVWRSAIAFRAARSEARMATRANAAATAAPVPVPEPQVPLEEEVASYRRFLDRTSGPPRPGFAASIFALTVVLFVVAGRYQYGAASVTATVLGIVLFHELGHYLAMRAFGYVDTTIFFVPFLGGVAAGRKDTANLTERMIVLLAGPLPGLLIGAAVVMTAPGSVYVVLRPLVVSALAVNLFNLLPLLPLDGGQVTHTLLFARRPWLDVGAKALAAAGLLAIGLATSQALLEGLGALAVVQLPSALRMTRVRREFREGRLARPDEAPEETFYRALRASPLGRSPFETRVALARATLTWAAVDVPIAVAPRLGWLSAYGAAIVLGVFAMIQVSHRAHPAPAPRTRHEVARASLSCASEGTGGDGPREVSRGNAPGAWLYGAVVFDSPDALGARQAALAAALPGALLRPLGPVLLLWHSVGRDSSASQQPAPSEAPGITAARMDALLQGTGGRYLQGPSPIVECEAPGPSEAGALHSTLASYANEVFDLNNSTLNGGVAPAPPWAEDSMPTAPNPPQRRLWILPSHDAALVRIQLLVLSPDSVESDVNPLLRWLCARSCVNPRVVLETYR